MPQRRPQADIRPAESEPSIDRFLAVRQLLAAPPSSAAWQIHHIDITCDGCEQEPIIGARYRCSVCQDRDLCARCYQALIAARVQGQRETGGALTSGDAGGVVAGSQRRLMKWARDLHAAGNEGPAARWAQLVAAVPCLDPRHEFRAVRGGAERQVCLEVKEVSALEEYLAAFPPSRCSCADLAWVTVCRPPVARHADESRIALATRDWEALRRRRAPTPADAAELAAQHGLRRGKWMLFPRTGPEADAAWPLVARACATGRLGDECKVSAAPPGGGHVICVYTDNYLDREAVHRVRDTLGMLGLRLRRRRLVYKPDIYTYLGIYGGRNSRENLGFQPSVYEAEIA